MFKTSSKEEGLEEVNISLDLNPKNEKGWYTKACILRELDRKDETLEALDEVIKLNSRYSEAWQMRGEILEGLEKYEESLRAFEEALKAYEKNYTLFNSKVALLSKGELLENMGRIEDALNTYQRLTTFHGDYKLGWIREIELLIELKRNSDAIISANRAIDKFEDMMFYILRGKAYHNIGNNEKAYISFQKAMEDDSPEARITYARFLSDNGEFDTALDILTESTREERLLRGNVLLEKGDFTEAKSIFEALIRENQDGIHTYYGLGVALIGLGEYKRASNALDVCLGISKDYEPAWYQKAVLYKKMGNFKKAREYAKILNSMSQGLYPGLQELLEDL